ncbi:tapasin-related protein-like isoform X7 [Dermochelys coriacea]|uniref:tapasin-related protein-like isoform X7 n=1 Tax=Dermochelys coriacea TaxID=27794 RepID=UPI0018E7CD4F|nr:tapasin-related protein-like isoform X7 [Dermochelys coriacea]
MINRSLISGVQPQLGHASRLLRSRLLLPPITLPPRLSWGPGAASLSLTPCGADTDSASVAMSRSPLTLLVILSLLGGCASKLAVETDASPMRAKVGDNVVLKCQFSVARPPVDLSQLVVQWFHRGGQLVEFDNVVSGSRPGANLSMEGLRSGNAALYLSKVTLESAGNYRCYITYMHDMRIKQVVLHVEDPSKTPTEEPEAVAPHACAPDPHPLVVKKLDQVLSILQQISRKLDVMGAGAGGEA